MVSKKKNKQEPKMDHETSSKKTLISASLMPFLLLIVSTVILSFASIAIMQNVVTGDTQKKAQDIHLQALAESTISLLSIRFAYTSRQLEGIANNETLIKALASNDETSLSAISGLLRNSFNDSISLRIIPWDQTATVGLKNRGIEMRNSIETLMLTRAGSGRTPPAEVYQFDKQWLISFAQPVIVDKEVKAIIFLSFDKQFFAGVITNAFYRENASISIIHKSSQNQNLVSNDVKAIGPSLRFDLPFTDGELSIASAKNVTDISHTALNTSYASIGASGLLLIIAMLLLSWFYRRNLINDVAALIHYGDSLTGLHRTMPPKLAYTELNELVSNLEAICVGNRSAVTPTEAGAASTDNKTTRSAPPSDKIATAEVAEEAAPLAIAHVFRDYDIRGHADKELSDNYVTLIGKAIGSEAASLNIRTIIVGRDGRLSGERILNALSKGITSTGCHVVDIGIVPTPLVYFAAEQAEDKSGVMITASHNPAADNGFKMVLAGKTLQGPQIQRLLKRIEAEDFTLGESVGSRSSKDFSSLYKNVVSNDILIAKPMKIVLDAGNGTGGELAQSLFQQLNCEVIPLYCEVDGNFPNHAPDPSKPENLAELCNEVVRNQADLGIAFDGDADRMVAVTSMGEIISGDKLLMIFAEDIVSRNPATSVIYDIKCSKHVRQIVQQYGGKPVMWKTGHANIKAKMQETGALLGGEYTGHFFFKERWFGFDDGIYAALRLVELLTNDNQTLDQRVGKLPSSFASPEITIRVPNDATKFDIIRKLQASLSNERGEITKLDGMRIDYEHGWGLVRASNTQAALSARFEADSKSELGNIQAIFKSALIAIDNNLTIPF